MNSYMIVTKRTILVAVAVILAAVFLILVFFNDSNGAAVSANSRLIPIYCTDRNDKKIAISFDAAWGNDDTQSLIDILDEYNVKATFFVVGQWVDNYPESVKALSDAGHNVCNHSDTHPYMTKLSKDEMAQQIENCNKKIQSVTGERPTLFRAPYGDYNNALIETLDLLGMNCIQWDVDSLDWQESATKESIIKNITSKVKSGSIILCHNDAEHTPEALPTVLKTLQDEGYEFVLIKDLIYTENYTIDHTGMQKATK